MAQNDSTILKVTDLVVSYGFVSALKDVSLEVHKGEFVALLGANGAGKSTFLESVLGIHKVKTGSISFRGEDITNKSTERIVASGIALCPEGRGILPKMNVIDNLLLGAYHNRQAIPEYLDRVFDLFPALAERRKQVAATLSGGEQQMLSIGRSLMSAPQLLMLDEPSLGLAPLLVNDIFNLIQKVAQQGYTVLLSEQNARKALEYSARAYIFETGKIVLEGDSAELMGNEAVIEAYLGGSKTSDNQQDFADKRDE